MSEEKPKKKRKKSAAEGDGTQEKEHKKNWREVYASVEDIKAFLGGRLYLRHNVITGRVECRLPSNYALLPRPPAAMGRAGLHHRTVGVHHHPRGRGEADALLRIPEEVARGDGGRMGRRECR